MAGLFVTGTDTAVGKSVLAACLLAAMRAEGRAVRAHKPIVSGMNEGAWPPDHVLLAEAAGSEPEQVCSLNFRAPLPPALAAEEAGFSLRSEQLLANASAAKAAAEADSAILIVEGAGGILAPLAERLSVLELARELALPLLIAARPGLGTINHSLLSIGAARGAGLTVAAVVLCGWPDQPGALERYNREQIAASGQVEVCCLPLVTAPERALLAAAGAALPWHSWIDVQLADRPREAPAQR